MHSHGHHLGVDGPVEDGGEEHGQHADDAPHLLHLIRCEACQAAACGSSGSALNSMHWTMLFAVCIMDNTEVHVPTELALLK